MINEKAVSKYCRDDLSKIENYDKAIADKTQTWHLHHRLELTLDGEFALTHNQLKMHDMYYNRPYYELIFLTPSEHSRLHTKGRPSPMKGHTLSEESRRKISEAMKGRTLTEETRRKISEANKNMSDETRRKISEAMKGENHPFYGKHHTDDTRKKMSEAHQNISDDTRRKMSESHKGKHLSKETRRKMSEAHKRKKF